MFDQRGELPLLPFGNPIGFVSASRGGVYIELSVAYNSVENKRLGLEMCSPTWSRTTALCHE